MSNKNQNLINTYNNYAPDEAAKARMLSSAYEKAEKAPAFSILSFRKNFMAVAGCAAALCVMFAGLYFVVERDTGWIQPLETTTAPVTPPEEPPVTTAATADIPPTTTDEPAPEQTESITQANTPEPPATIAIATTKTTSESITVPAVPPISITETLSVATVETTTTRDNVLNAETATSTATTTRVTSATAQPTTTTTRVTTTARPPTTTTTRVTTTARPPTTTTTRVMTTARPPTTTAPVVTTTRPATTTTTSIPQPPTTTTGRANSGDFLQIPPFVVVNDVDGWHTKNRDVANGEQTPSATTTSVDLPGSSSSPATTSVVLTTQPNTSLVPEPPNTTDNDPSGGWSQRALSVENETRIRHSYMTVLSGPGHSSVSPGVNFTADQLGLLYLGTYNGNSVVVFGVPGRVYTEQPTSITVGGHTILFIASGYEILVHTPAGEFMSLSTAFNRGLLTEQQIITIKNIVNP